MSLDKTSHYKPTSNDHQLKSGKLFFGEFVFIHTHFEFNAQQI